MKKWLTLNKEANWVLKILYFLMTVLEITVHKKKTLTDNIQLRMLLPGTMLHVCHWDNISREQCEDGGHM